MAMKNTSGGDSPLRQGAGKSFWTLPIFGSTAAVDRDVFWKSDWVLGFSRRGVFIGEGAVSEVVLVGHTIGGAGQPQVTPPGGVAHQWLLSVSPLMFWKLREISRRLTFVSSNSENISCVTFLKHKNSRK
jgi:hypothetical protein